MKLKVHRQGPKILDGSHCRYRCFKCPGLNDTAWRVIAEPQSPIAKRMAGGCGRALLETFAHEHQLLGTVAAIERMVGYAARREGLPAAGGRRRA